MAEAINQRMSELGLNQSQLIGRSRVSKATVGELQRNSSQRRRGVHTLEALSLALDWHPDHLHAILTGRRPPAPDAPVIRPDNDISARLAIVEDQLDQMITTCLAGFTQLGDQLAALNANIEHLIRNQTPTSHEHRDH